MICASPGLAKSNDIRIPTKNTLLKPTNYNYKKSAEYSLTQNLFDPSQASPPNEFLQKLYKRMHIHEQSGIIVNKCALK